jgi:4-hydroxythreonine-4-phosphate dehydrogenase
MSQTFRPIIGITMGDAAGIGPEVIVKALIVKEIYNICRPLVIGDAKAIARAVKVTQASVKLRVVEDVNEAMFEFGVLDVLDLKNLDLPSIEVGTVNRDSGRAAVEFVEKAVKLALNQEIHAIATAPLNKEAINLAGYQYQGHTEILAHLTKTRNYAMMLVAGSLRVIHVTTHVSLREACDLIDKKRVLNTIVLAHETLTVMGIKNPRIAVSGLNPHAGESGLFGGEEQNHIAPAVQEAIVRGINVQGPLPPDTVFLKAAENAFDVVIAMYHDQGHIPVKLLGFDRGVNITLGLPIIRTSVDHGTAFDIAGTGVANPTSMMEAIKMAVDFASHRFGNLFSN